MKIINTIDKELSVQIRTGQEQVATKYVLPALGELKNVPEVHASYWKNNLHSFLKLESEGKEKEEKIVIEKEESEKPKDTVLKLEELTRAELDEMAVEVKLDPKDYQNKAQLIEALTKE